jgi:hypothetical protein
MRSHFDNLLTFFFHNSHTPVPEMPLFVSPSSSDPIFPKSASSFLENSEINNFENLESFLGKMGVAQHHLNNLVYFVETMYPAVQSPNSDRVTLESLAENLVYYWINSSVNPENLPQQEKDFLMVLVMLSALSHERKGHDLFGNHFDPAEWLLIYLAEKGNTSLVNEVLASDTSSFSVTIQSLGLAIDIKSLREFKESEPEWGSLVQKVRTHWFLELMSKRSKLCGKHVFDAPFAVPTLRKNQTWTIIPCVQNPVEKVITILRLKRTMHIGERCYLVDPSVTTTDCVDERILGGAFNDHTVNTIPLPVKLLTDRYTGDQKARDAIEQWLETILDVSFWNAVTEFPEANIDQLKRYALNTYRSDLVQSGLALGLLRELLRSSDRQKQKFYKKLGSAISVSDSAQIKIYWIMGLLKKIIGPQRPIFMLPIGYDEVKARQVYSLLDRLFNSKNLREPEPFVMAECLEILRTDTPTQPLLPTDSGSEFWEFWSQACEFSGCQVGAHEYQRWLTENPPEWFVPVKTITGAIAGEVPKIKLADYATALGLCAQAALYYLQECLNQSSDTDKQAAFEVFLKAFVHYHYCSLFELDSLQTSGRDAYIESRFVPYEWYSHSDHLRPSEENFTRQNKDLVFFLVLIKDLLPIGTLGKENQLFFEFARYLTTHYLPLTPQDIERFKESKDESDSQIETFLGMPGFYRAPWQHYPTLLSLGCRSLPFSFFNGRLEPITPEQPESAGVKIQRLLLSLSGHSPDEIQYNNAHGRWLKILPFYLFGVIISQWVMLRVPILSQESNDTLRAYLRGSAPRYPSNSTSMMSTTISPMNAQNLEFSDIAFGVVMLLVLERMFENFGGCSKVLRHPVIQGMWAGLWIITAGGLEGVGFYLLGKNPDDINATTLLVFGNSMLFIMMAGAPSKLAAELSPIFSPIFPEALLRFFYECVAPILKSSPEKQNLIRLHLNHVSNQTMYAALFTTAISVACLNFPSFLANLIGNLPSNTSTEYGQDITFGGVTAAILVPTAVFFCEVVGDPRFKWFKVIGELSQPGEQLKTRLGALDWIQLGLMLLAGGAAGLVIWYEWRFLDYQHGTNKSEIFSNATYKTPFMRQKGDLETLSIVLAVLCFIVLKSIQAYIHADKNPYFGSTQRPKDKLVGCSKISTCISNIFSCGRSGSDKGETEPVRPWHVHNYGATK